jgi:hypothetical protein
VYAPGIAFLVYFYFAHLSLFSVSPYTFYLKTEVNHFPKRYVL